MIRFDPPVAALIVIMDHEPTDKGAVDFRFRDSGGGIAGVLRVIAAHILFLKKIYYSIS
ncbi:hypothetical protein AGMMS49940_01290 [Spirochaetia bacterium]|nr:hypothetical protein AGMMS49940_01290 [Spirochaetia bacterium]